jgi:hypothetical protein
VPGRGDNAILYLSAGGDEGAISVRKGDVDILIVSSGPAAEDAAILKQAVAQILTHLS